MSVPLRIEYCNADAPVVRRRSVRRRRVSRPLRRVAGVAAISAILSVIGLAAVGAASLLHGFSSSADLHLVSSGAPGALSAIMGSAHRNNGYVTVAGSVLNSSGKNASNVEAVVELIDSQNRTVQMDQSMVAFSSVSSGESAPFSVVIPDDSLAVGYRLTFRHPDGSSIQ